MPHHEDDDIAPEAVSQQRFDKSRRIVTDARPEILPGANALSGRMRARCEECQQTPRFCKCQSPRFEMKRTLTVYLAGAIHGCTDLEANWWRNEVIASLSLPNIIFLNPMDRDYRGGYSGAAEVVEADYEDIKNCDIVLVMANRPTWGTAMEIPYAKGHGKDILIVYEGRPHPWLEYHATTIFPHLRAAIRRIEYLAGSLLSAE